MASPEVMARIIREECGFNNAKAVNLQRIIDHYHIKLLQTDKLDPRTAAASKVVGMNKLIVINCSYYKMCYTQYARFTIAHEIGHIFLHKGNNICGSEIGGHKTTSMKEREANQFASELLLPKAVVLNEMKYKDLSILTAQRLSEMYDISLTASLVACVKYTEDEVVLISHTDNVIDWKYLSSNCCSLVSAFPLDTQIVEKARRDGMAAGMVDGLEWSDNYNSRECHQETLYFGNLKRYITVLNIVTK